MLHPKLPTITQISHLDDLDIREGDGWVRFRKVKTPVVQPGNIREHSGNIREHSRNIREHQGIFRELFRKHRSTSDTENPLS
jgi:hypothetical protein